MPNSSEHDKAGKMREKFMAEHKVFKDDVCEEDFNLFFIYPVVLEPSCKFLFNYYNILLGYSSQVSGCHFRRERDSAFPFSQKITTQKCYSWKKGAGGVFLCVNVCVGWFLTF